MVSFLRDKAYILVNFAVDYEINEDKWSEGSLSQLGYLKQFCLTNNFC